MASLDAQVDPKSAWALSEFREAKITLGLLDQAKQAGRQALGTGVRMDSVHVAYQGECLAGRLVVKLDNTDDPSIVYPYCSHITAIPLLLYCSIAG